MSTKAITLWGHEGGPNPWKVAIILEELGIPYEHKFVAFPDMKKEPFESLNPNGRVPAIEDPNTGIKVWESGACIDYILDTYDKSSTLTPTDPQAKWFARSWRDFQMSGQGPYTGQRVWFTRYHHEKIDSAIERYAKEVARIVGVIDRHLAKTKSEYLTGNQVTYADLMFVPWFLSVDKLLPEGTVVESAFPDFHKWWQRILERASVKKVQKDKADAMAAASH